MNKGVAACFSVGGTTAEAAKGIREFSGEELKLWEEGLAL